MYVLIRPVDRKEFEGRTFPHVYDVIVYQEAGHYYAKDAYGNVICVDSSTGCLQEGINHGKHIYIKGEFGIPTPINITNSKTIYIDGYVDSIQVTDQYQIYIDIIGIGNSYYVDKFHIGNLYLDNNANRITFRNLKIRNATIKFAGFILFDSCDFRHVELSGYDWNRPPYWITFLRSWIQNTDPNGNGIDINTALHILFINSAITHNQGTAVNISNGRFIKFVNTSIEDNGAGMSIDTADVVMEEVHTYANRDYTIRMGPNSILVLKDHTEIANTTSGNDIIVDSTSAELIIDRTSWVGNIVGREKLRYFKSDFPNYLTKRSDVDIIKAGSTSVTVTHWMACAPRKVLVTPLQQPPGQLWVSNITATSFDINVSTAPTTDLPVAWYAEC